MLTIFLIAFREAFEAALLLGIVVRYLEQTERHHFLKSAFWGVGAGVLVSSILGFLLFRFGGGLEGEAHEVLERVVAIASIILIGTFLFWIKHHATRAQISAAVDAHTVRFERWGVFALVGLSVLREGLETALFTFASQTDYHGSVVAPLALGVAIAMLVGYTIFAGLAKVPIRFLFLITGFFLIVLAAHIAGELFEEFGEFTEHTVTAVVFLLGTLLWWRDLKPRAAAPKP